MQNLRMIKYRLITPHIFSRSKLLPLVQILGDKQVQQTELKFSFVLLLLVQPGKLICNTPCDEVLAASIHTTI